MSESLIKEFLKKILSLKTRAENLEDKIRISMLVTEKLSPSDVLEEIDKAEAAQDLYNQAKRRADLLPQNEKFREISIHCRRKITKMHDILNLLNQKAAVWDLA